MRNSLFFLFLLAHCPSFAQNAEIGTLKPRLFVNESDTSFCFTSRQAKELAKLITIGEFSKAEIDIKKKEIEALSSKIEMQQSIIVLREEQIKAREEKLGERDGVIVRHENLNALQESVIKDLEKQVRKERRKTRAGVALAVLVGLVSIIF